ncbi:MAG: dihydropteroate synthase [Candidatus Saccharicenans sp.]|nr:MAG: methyltetrahydrofolate--corrinoid methyltransferase [Candidatus Aminicenantes bacterium]HEK85124.1 methyltetrahydrofolate cobalamin methyltransferase [Candidatus Aminicenantes bacterium]
MIVIGELLNASRQRVQEAFLKKDEEFIIDLAIQQEKAGCSYLNLNAASLVDKEAETLSWAVSIIQQKISIPLAIDSSNPQALEAGFKVNERRALLNSLTGKKEESAEIISLIREYNPEVIVSCLDDHGLAESPEKAVKIADRVLNNLFQQTSIQKDDIFIDPVVRPLSVVPEAAKIYLETVMLLKREFPGIKLIAALANISFGLPKRKLVNHAFLSSLIGHGVTAVIADPLQPYFWSVVLVGEFIGNIPGANNRFMKWAEENKKDEQ